MQEVFNSYNLHLVGGSAEDKSNDPKYLCWDLIPTEARVLSLGLSWITQVGFDAAMLHAGHKVVGVDPSVPSCYTAWKLGQMYPKFSFLAKAVTGEDGLTRVRYEKNQDFEMAAIPSHDDFKQFEEETYREVESVSLDTLIKLYGGFDVLQMNIEGFEYDIIKSIKSLDIAQVIVSFHDRCCEEYSKEDTLECVHKLEELGYETIDLYDVDPDWIEHPQEEYLFLKPSSSKKITV
jgi:FkbM family methyltransferase